MHRRETPLTMFLYALEGHEIFQLFIADQLNLIDLVRRAKTIHEMKEGHPTLQSSNLCNDCHVMGFLNTKAG